MWSTLAFDVSDTSFSSVMGDDFEELCGYGICVVSVFVLKKNRELALYFEYEEYKRYFWVLRSWPKSLVTRLDSTRASRNSWPIRTHFSTKVKVQTWRFAGWYPHHPNTEELLVQLLMRRRDTKLTLLSRRGIPALTPSQEYTVYENSESANWKRFVCWVDLACFQPSNEHVCVFASCFVAKTMVPAELHRLHSMRNAQYYESRGDDHLDICSVRSTGSRILF